MGLNQTAYVTDTADTKGEEIACWRKHNRLQGWMDVLWHHKGNVTSEEENAQWGTSFNGQKLFLTLEDIAALEIAVKEHTLPETYGFFFGNDSYGYKNDNGEYESYETDLKFLEDARKYLNEGKLVYYRCTW